MATFFESSFVQAVKVEGSSTGNTTLYTVPSSRYARVIINYLSATGTLEITQTNGSTVQIDLPDEVSGANGAIEFYLMTGQSLKAVASAFNPLKHDITILEFTS